MRESDNRVTERDPGLFIHPASPTLRVFSTTQLCVPLSSEMAEGKVY